MDIFGYKQCLAYFKNHYKIKLKLYFNSSSQS